MESATERARSNLDSSILFMQEEHAAILKGLHEEIARLQKKCSDLTFQLTMNGLSIDEPDAVDDKMAGVQRELDSSKSKLSILEKKLAEKDKRVEKLEAEARTSRKRWLDESRSQSQAMNTLKAELEAKTNTVNYLTAELHRLKQQARGSAADIPPAEPSPAHHSLAPGPPNQPAFLHADSKQSTKSSFSAHVPAPPTRERTLGASASTRLRRSGHRGAVGGVAGKAITASGHPASAEAARLHPPRLGSGRSSGSDSPDITPFLPASKEDMVALVGGKAAPILPPIQAAGGPTPVVVVGSVSATSQHRGKNAPSIVSLAVGNAVQDSAFNLAHESHSGELN